MLAFGDKPMLECSSRGDKRFSAFYARLAAFNGKSIEEVFQATKVFEGGITNLSVKEAKGRKAINQREVANLYHRLWDMYFEENPELVHVILKYNGFSDMFGQSGHLCQAEEIYRIKLYFEKAYDMPKLKIISGGQKGADRGGLEAARALGIETGGIAPKGYKTEEGEDLTLKEFGLTEDASTGYTQRTILNVQNSDVTIIFADKIDSSGTKLTIKACKDNKKFYIIVKPHDLNSETHVGHILDFLRITKPLTINIAGNRESVAPGICDLTMNILIRALFIYEGGEVKKEESRGVKGAVTEIKPKQKENCMNLKLVEGSKERIFGIDVEIKNINGELIPWIGTLANKESSVNWYVGQLMPTTVEVEGIRWVVEDDVPKWKKDIILINPNSEFYREFIIKGDMVVHACSQEPEKQEVIYNYLLSRASTEGKILLGRFKSVKEMTLVAGTKEKFEELLGDVLGDNPAKQTGPMTSPEQFNIHRVERVVNGESSLVKKVRIAIVPKTTVDEVIGKYIVTDDQDVIPFLDGACFFSHALYFESRKAIKKRDGSGKRPSYKRAYAAQLRTNCFFYDGSYAPREKMLGVFDHTMFDLMANIFGIDPDSVDVIQTMYNVKTRKDDVTPYTVYERDIESFKFINIQLSKGKSAIGFQGIRLYDADSGMNPVRELLRNKGAVLRAEYARAALNADVYGLKEIMAISGEDKWSSKDKLKMLFPIRCKDGKLRIPRYKSNHTVLMTRVYTYLMQHVFKCRLSDMSFYLLGNPICDVLERWYFEQTGKVVKFSIAPNANKVRERHENGERPDVGRHPIVGFGNLQGHIIIGFNCSTDIWMTSNYFAFDAEGDFDGDKCSINFSALPGERFGTTRRHVIKNEKPRGSDISEDYTEVVRTNMQAVFQSMRDTGNIDNLIRQIIVMRWLENRPLKPSEIDEMGFYYELAIQGMKWLDKGVSKDIPSVLTAKFLGYKMPKVEDLPWLCKCFRKDGGNNRHGQPMWMLMENIVDSFKNLKDSNRHNPFNEVFDALKTPKVAMIEEEVTEMQNRCKVHYTLERAKGDTLYKENDLEWAVNILINGDLNNVNAVFSNMGYGTEAKLLNEQYKNNPRQRRIAFSDLSKRYMSYIDQLGNFFATGYYSDQPIEVQVEKKVRAQYLMMLKLGSKAFRAITITNPDGSSSLVSSPGGCFWCFPEMGCIVPFAKAVAGNDQEKISLIDEVMEFRTSEDEVETTPTDDMSSAELLDEPLGEDIIEEGDEEYEH